MVMIPMPNPSHSFENDAKRQDKIDRFINYKLATCQFLDCRKITQYKNYEEETKLPLSVVLHRDRSPRAEGSPSGSLARVSRFR